MIYTAPLDTFRGEPTGGAAKDDVARWRQSLINRFPEQLRRGLRNHHQRTARRQGYAEANRELNKLYKATLLPGMGLTASASEYEIDAYADRLAQRLQREFYVMARSKDLGKRAALEWLKLELNRRELDIDITGDKDELISQLLRLFEKDWWVRLLKRRQRHIIEQTARLIRMVSAYASPYCSTWTLDQRKAQKSKNKRILQSMEAVSEDGESVNLWDCVQSSTANPELRRKELMTRMRGFENVSQLLDHVAMFYTITTPSKYHCALTKRNMLNPTYEGATPRQAQDYLNKLWSKARAWLNRRGIVVYGFRVAEPHHDGTPHWHMLFFMEPKHRTRVTECLRKYAMQEDEHEPGAWKYRFEAVEIDPEKGSATGYIAKYIAKNIDGEHVDYDDETGTEGRESASRVDAWAACWGIRQFQQIGGPSVTVWRELRRVSEDEVDQLVADNDYAVRSLTNSPVELFFADKADEQSKRIEKLWRAADDADWCAFCLFQGGPTMPRSKQFLKLWKIGQHEDGNPIENSFGELVELIHGVSMPLVGLCSRAVKWTIRRAANSEASASPWSSVNNCTGGDPPTDTELIEQDYQRGSG